MMVQMINERIASKAKYQVLKYVQMGVLDLEDIANWDMRQLTEKYLRAVRLKQEIAKLQEVRRQRMFKQRQQWLDSLGDYQRLNLSRRRNAVRESLAGAGAIERVVITTRFGQVVLYEPTDSGRMLCSSLGIAPGPVPRESMEHRFWVGQAAHWFENRGYEVVREHPVKGNGAIDILATKPGEQVAVEVETGKSDVKENIDKICHAGFDRIVLLATSPSAVGVCQKVTDSAEKRDSPPIELLTWLDIS
jgi:hypothetical protein